jgi:large subunit ribosomal protein L9
MPKTEVILTQNIVGLGAESDQVKVAAGYARNYLLPQGLAIPVTAANKRRLEALRQRRAERETHEFNTMSELAQSLSKLTVVVPVKTGEDGKMFGSVTPGSIADELKHHFDVALDKKKIHLPAPIRALGDYDVELHLHSEVHTTLKVRVESTTPIAQTEKAPPRKEAAAARKDAPRKDAAGRADARPESKSADDKGAEGKKKIGTERKPRPEKAEKKEPAA